MKQETAAQNAAALRAEDEDIQRLIAERRASEIAEKAARDAPYEEVIRQRAAMPHMCPEGCEDG